MSGEKASKNNYGGRFVATASFFSKKILAQGRDPKDVKRRAAKKADSPVIRFEPDAGACFLL